MQSKGKLQKHKSKTEFPTEWGNTLTLQNTIFFPILLSTVADW